MKKNLLIILTILIIVGFISFINILAFSNREYGDSFYSALNIQYERLEKTEGERVIMIGGSSVSFGMDSQLFESLYGREFVSFGLYGAFGTKAMLDLSLREVKRDDIVIVAPETVEQSYSLYFNGKALIKAFEEHPERLLNVNIKDYDKIIGSLIPFVIEKRNYKNEKTTIDSIYKADSINKYGEIRDGLRCGNVMREGFLDEEIMIDIDNVQDEFFDYLNEYINKVKRKGAKIFFSFPPLNEKALNNKGIGVEELYNFYDDLSKKLDTDIISDPTDYIFDYRYFYDSNYHLNDAGKILRTVQLVRDLRKQDKNPEQINITLPKAPDPIISTKNIDHSINYTDSNLFLFEESGDYLVLVGTKGELENYSEIIVPVEHGGKYIIKVKAGAFSNLDNLEKITIPIGIEELANEAFKGCKSLKEIYFCETKGENIKVYDSTFDGVSPNCKIYLLNANVSDFTHDYFWARINIKIESLKNN